MTLEELYDKMESRFDRLDAKVDTLNTTVALHGQSLANNEADHKRLFGRLEKVEKWMWLSIGAGGAAGAGLAKLFL